MLSQLYPHLLQRNKKYVYEWNKAISDSHAILNYNMSRYTQMDFLLNEVTKRLKTCVLYIDMDYINTLSSDVDIYLSYIEPLRFKIEAFFNSVFPTSTRGAWLSNNSTCEVMIPIQSVDPLDNLPIDSNWGNGWDSVKALNIHYFDSIELSYNLINKLNFTLFNPTLFITTIDITKFILKYVKFTRTVENKQDLEKYVDNYVYTYLYLPLVNDMFNVWVFNIVNRSLEVEDSVDLDVLLNSQLTSLTPPSVKTGIKFLNSNIVSLENKSMVFEDFVSTDYFNNRSLSDIVKYNLQEVRTYNLLQYKHSEFLLELPLIKMIHDVNKKNKHNTKKPIDIVYERGIINYVNNKVSDRYNNSIIKNYVDNTLYSML